MGKKSTLAFSCAALDEKHPQVVAVTPSVNGVPLPRLVSEFERMKEYEPVGGGIWRNSP